MFVSQHPARSNDGPGSKHVDEWLPLLILAKHEAGRHKNWDALLYLKVSFGDDALDEKGRNYDACYWFNDQNRKYGERSGFIEITRGISEEQSIDLKRRDRDLSLGKFPDSAAEEFDAGVEEMKAQILNAISKKARKATEGAYPDGTILLIWLREELNPAYGRIELSKDGFMNAAREASQGLFAGVVIVGVTCGVIWVEADGL